MTWRERLARAQKWDEFTEDDCDTATDWSTCYVGEHGGNPPTATNERGDPKIRRLGLEFFDAVCTDDVPEAIRIADALDALWAGARP